MNKSIFLSLLTFLSINSLFAPNIDKWTLRERFGNAMKAEDTDEIKWLATLLDIEEYELHNTSSQLPDVLETPLIWAIRRGKLRTVRALLEVGANPNKRSKKLYEPGGYAPLYYAKKNDEAATRLLLEFEANPDIPDAQLN